MHRRIRGLEGETGGDRNCPASIPWMAVLKEKLGSEPVGRGSLGKAGWSAHLWRWVHILFVLERAAICSESVAGFELKKVKNGKDGGTLGKNL